MTKKQRKILIRIIISALLTVILNLVNINGLTGFLCYLAVYIIIGYDILKKAFRGIANGQILDENFLMTVATIGAFVLAVYTKSSDYNEAVAVMIFYQTGELFQSVAVRKSRKNIAELMDIRPETANIEIDGKLVTVSPYEVKKETVITVQPGEKIALDGVVVSGSSYVDTVALTGESIPRTVKENDKVVSGSVNIDGVLKIRTEKEYSDSTVSKILELVENATSKKSKSEKFISKFARYYTPVVCVLALLLAVITSLYSFVFLKISNFDIWLYRSLTFLVISCPCALVISIPLSFFAGIGGISKEGILVKGSNYLETLSKVKCVVFDKTGTLTQGVFKVNQIFGDDKEKIIKYAAYAECASSHPVAKSIVEAYGKEIDRNRVCNIKEISGLGVTAIVDNTSVAVGNSKLMSDLNINHPLYSLDKTAVYVAVDNKYIGTVTISDIIKTNSKKAICDLKKAGIEKTVMLTGDLNQIANSVSAKLEIDETFGELLPTDKMEKLEEILFLQKGVAFVGDGINDAPCLARADVGIAMGGIGSDAAIEAADIVLMDDDPLKIVKAIKHSKKVMRIVKQNIWFSLFVKFGCLLLVAIGIGNMWFGIFADVGVMVLAILNSIRTLKRGC